MLLEPLVRGYDWSHREGWDVCCVRDLHVMCTWLSRDLNTI